MQRNAHGQFVKGHREGIKHGLALRHNTHPIYTSWKNMRQRCSNPRRTDFKYYGGRGICIDVRWDSFDQFAADMLPTWRLGLTLERKNNDGPYSKENCVWETRFEQSQNSRQQHMLEHEGKRQSIAQWARELKLSEVCLRMRVHRSWPTAQVLSA